MRDRIANKAIAQVTAKQLAIAPPKPDMGEVVKQAILQVGESADENSALMRELVKMLMDTKPQPIKKWVVKVVPETSKDSIRYGMAKEYIFTAE